MKQTVKFNKKLLSVAILVALPCISMANEALEQIKQLTVSEFEQNQRALDEFRSMDQNHEGQRTPKGKQELEAIFGTWLLSYTFDGTQQTDKLIINGLFTAEDGSIHAVGGLFLNNGGNEKTLFCSELPLDLTSFLESDYTCLSGFNDTVMRAYNFRISGDTVTSGFYGEGDSTDSMAESMTSKKYSITGSRGSESSIGGGDNEAIFNESSNELIIPVLNYRGSKYRVILQDTGGFLFSIKDARPVR